MNQLGQPEYNHQLTSALVDDVNAARAQLLEKDAPYRRRTLVRTFFAAVEGHTSALKQIALRRLETDPGIYSLSPAELSILRGKAYALDEKGRPISRRLYTPPAEIFLFSLRMYAKSLLQEYSVDRNNPGFAALKSALQVRNRITHPQSPADLEIDNTDLQVVIRAMDWWQERYRECVEESARQLIEMARKIPKITPAKEILKRSRRKKS